MIELLYEDADLIAVNKPEQLLCVPGLCATENLFDQLRKYFPNVRVIHRLDMATSGVMLFALSHASQKSLGQQFEQRRIKKRYVAEVEGRVQMGYGEVVTPLLCDWPNRPKQKVDWLHGKHAHTLFEVIEHRRTSTLLALYPLTGRSHQLRVHCRHLGHPILGDTLYAADGCSTSASRLMLHAELIEFCHPTTGVTLTLHCPAPFDNSLSRT